MISSGPLTESDRPTTRSTITNRHQNRHPNTLSISTSHCNRVSGHYAICEAIGYEVTVRAYPDTTAGGNAVIFSSAFAG
mgnify:CR=1 FL=1